MTEIQRRPRYKPLVRIGLQKYVAALREEAAQKSDPVDAYYPHYFGGEFEEALNALADEILKERPDGEGHYTPADVLRDVAEAYRRIAEDYGMGLPGGQQ